MPLDKVGCELDDGVVISESTAISRYIEGQQPQPPLMGKTPREQAYISMWQRRVEDGLLYAAQHYFHHATPGLGEPDRYRNAAAGGRTIWKPVSGIWLLFRQSGPGREYLQVD